MSKYKITGSKVNLKRKDWKETKRIFYAKSKITYLFKFALAWFLYDWVDVEEV